MGQQARKSVTAAQLRDAIDHGRGGDKVPFSDPAAAPLGTDDEAAGAPPTEPAVNAAMAEEIDRVSAHSAFGDDANSATHNRASFKPLLVTFVILAIATIVALWLM